MLDWLSSLETISGTAEVLYIFIYSPKKKPFNLKPEAVACKDPYLET